MTENGENTASVLRVQTDDSELDELLEQIAERLRTTDHVDIDAYAQQYPHLADRLRQLVSGMQALTRLGYASQSRAGSSDASLVTSTPQDGTLGDFRIIREIGRGGMGIVYEAEQISLRRRVALKVLPFAAVLDKRQLQRFKTEAKAAARLHHPHIVPVYQVGCERAVHFYAMQYIEGRNVSELLDEIRQSGSSPKTQETDPDATQPAPATDARSAKAETAVLGNLSTDHADRRETYYRSAAALGIQAAEALDFAHEHGILHRDIKPSNLMLDGDEQLWITDFGLARIEGDAALTMSGDLLGTLRYMSPEQALGKRVIIDERADIYSLGVTLYEILTLRTAYAGTDRAELLRKISFEEPTPPRRIDPSIPADLEAIVLTAMAHDPGQRYQTARELAEDLQRFLDHKPIRARRPTRLDHVRKWVRRNKSLSASLALVLLAVVVAGAGIFAVISNRNPSSDSAAVLPDLAPTSPPLGFAPGRYLPGLIAEPTFVPDIGRWQLITKRPRGVIRSVVWSPDERRVALAEANHVRIYDAGSALLLHDLRKHEVRDRKSGIYDAGSALLLHVLVAHSQPVRSVAWHPDGERLASCSEDGTVRLWTSAGRPTHLLQSHTGPVYQVAWSPNGRQLASCGADGTVRLWNADGEPLRMLDEGGRHVFGIDWSPDGRRLATVGGDIRPAGADGDPGDNSLRVWNVESGELIRKLDPSVRYSGLCVDWSPDGGQVAVGYGHVYRQMHWPGNPLPDAGVRIWNSDGMPGPEIGRDNGSVRTVAWSPSGDQLAFAGRSRIVGVWNADNLEVTDIDVADKYEFFSLCWSRDAARLLIGRRDSVHEWDGHRVTESLTAGIGRQFSFYRCTWSPDGTLIAGAQLGSGFEFWSSDGAPVSAPERPAGDVPAWWEADNPARRPDGSPPPDLEGPLRADSYTKFAWSRDGWLASASWYDQTVRIWDHEGKLIASCTGHRGGVESVAWSPDGTQVVSGGGDSVRIWNRDGTPGPVMTGHTDEVYGVAWSPNGQWIASGGTDATVRLWKPDGTAGAVLRGHQGGVFAVGWSPDSKRLVSGSWLDGTLRVWDVETGRKEWQALRLDADTAVALSPAGQLLHGDHDMAESSLLYLVEQHDGSMSILSPSAFHSRYTAKLLLQQLSDKDLDDAVVACDLLLRVQQPDSNGHVSQSLSAKEWASIGIRFVELGELDHAISATQRAIELKPDYATAWSNLGNYFADQGKADDAVAAYRKGLEFEPQSSFCMNGLAWFFAVYPDTKLRDPLQAVELADKAVELAPEKSSVWNTLGVAQYRTGDYPAAIASLQKSIELGGEQHRAHDCYFLAMAHWQLGDHVEASDWYARAIEWMEANASDNDELIRFRAEAEELIGISAPQEVAAEIPQE